MLIKTKLSERDFINVNFILMYSRFYVKFFTCITLLILLIFPLRWSVQSNVSFSELVGPLAMLAFIPLITFFGAKRNYKANKRIQEPIEYQIDSEFLKIKGESFNSQQTWDKISKVTKKKKLDFNLAEPANCESNL
jgi:hypothetical protein